MISVDRRGVKLQLYCMSLFLKYIVIRYKFYCDLIMYNNRSNQYLNINTLYQNLKINTKHHAKIYHSILNKSTIFDGTF